MLEMNTHAGNLRLIGGRLCLDFVNTVDCHTCAQPKEHLVDYGALVGWGRHAGLLAPHVASQLLSEAARRPAEAAQALIRARLLRRALYSLFTGALSDQTEQAGLPNEIDILNRMLAETSAHTGITRTRAGFNWAWAGDACRLDELLAPIAWSSAELLTSNQLALVRECEGERCSWLFLDTSRNRGRRWCSMADCGNRAKARRHYAQRRVMRDA
jgi:predicted RNA-binding Zn ribbon-like protein